MFTQPVFRFVLGGDVGVSKVGEVGHDFCFCLNGVEY